MFDSLVESGSHKDDIARKGSFFLGTFIIYAVVLVGLGILSIFLYDAHLESQNLELVTLVAPPPVAPQPEVKPQKQEEKPAATKEPQVNMRTEIAVIAPVTKSNEMAKAETKVIERAKSAYTIVGRENKDATGPPVLAANVGLSTGTGGGGTGPAAPVVTSDDEPPPPPKPAPTPPPKPKTIVSGGVLTGKAISKPQPAYPPIAKAARASGAVTVQIVVGEDGRVISASAVSGHPLLQQAAVNAVRGWRFSPTLLSGQPVKVSGVVTVNFTLQ